jgi:peptidoglycan/xylan/chitin deacetylase (PgdA/CDA1 family)
MFYHHDINGADLPDGTVCLTYDDGPGEHTIELARYLNEQNVQAAFFVVGAHAARRSDALQALHAQGHLIGNHTYTHAGLVNLLAAGGDAVWELAQTDALIRPFAADAIFFRPPYGSWRPEQADDADGAGYSAAAEALNHSGRLADYIGPVMWDVTGGDWGCWERREPVEDAVRRYLGEIERVRRGIVLMHDSSETPEFARRNQTFELTKRLVPELKRRGYRFIGLKSIPAIRRLSEAAPCARPV